MISNQKYFTLSLVRNFNPPIFKQKRSEKMLVIYNYSNVLGMLRLVGTERRRSCSTGCIIIKQVELYSTKSEENQDKSLEYKYRTYGIWMGDSSIFIDILVFEP